MQRLVLLNVQLRWWYREVMDAMYRPYNFHKTFFCSYSYVFTLVIPNTIFVYWGFPTEAKLYGKPCPALPCLPCPALPCPAYQTGVSVPFAVLGCHNKHLTLQDLVLSMRS